ncbi:MAG: DUF1768 domain-containing protein [Candidatus Lokiarchaeota archaeon]|nr:DUF1768 domain-containing protein [Candidatus Lokiarchaeota archaeon]
MPEIINRFKGKYRFLSNFYPCEIEYNGIKYTTLEHAYQASKTLNNESRKKIAEKKTPALAKKMGRRVPLRKNWEEIKLKIMEKLVRIKFSTHPDLKSKLLDTGDAELIEGNNWGDNYWGVYNGKGENHLGKILMKIREELQNKE